MTVDFAASTLKDILHQKREKHITISHIKQQVSEFFKLDIEELSAKIRTKDIALARQIAMYLSKELTNSSLIKIGQNFGGRDHTTVLHACDKIKELVKNDSYIFDVVQTIKKKTISES